MKPIAVVPVKETSDRVASKNFRPFSNGQCLLEVKLKQLVESNAFDRIFVSSNASKAESISKEFGCEFIQRDVTYCSNDISWSDVIHHVVDTLPVEGNTPIAWCHTTSPLFSNFAKAVKTFQTEVQNGDSDGLIAVERFSEFVVSERGRPLNYHWGIWHDYSQHMEAQYRVTGALFMANKATMLKNRYVVSKHPFLFNTSQIEGIDIDTQFDFLMAQKCFEDSSFSEYRGKTDA